MKNVFLFSTLVLILLSACKKNNLTRNKKVVQETLLGSWQYISIEEVSADDKTFIQDIPYTEKIEITFEDSGDYKPLTGTFYLSGFITVDSCTDQGIEFNYRKKSNGNIHGFMDTSRECPLSNGMDALFENDEIRDVDIPHKDTCHFYVEKPDDLSVWQKHAMVRVN